MEIQTVNAADGRVILKVLGEVDRDTSPLLRRQVLPLIAAGTGVGVDLQGVTRLDSSGLATLIEAHQHAAERRQDFRLSGVDAGVLRLLRLTHLDHVLTIDDGQAGPSVAST